MHLRIRGLGRPGAGVVAALLALPLPVALQAQNQVDRLRALPGYEQYTRTAPQLQGAFTLASLQGARWAEDSRAFDFEFDGKRLRYDLATKRIGERPPAAAPQGGGTGRGGRGGVERGRQADQALSPDGKLRAFYRDRNLWLGQAGDTTGTPITTDGSEKARTKFGSASWVYGEELRQTTAMWWSPDGTKLAFYGMDESGVPDYFLQLGQTRLQSSVDVEAYPKAGVPNPVVEVFVYDVATKRTTKVDVRDGKPFTNDVVGHYVYNVGWTPDGKELTFNRTNRRQNTMELTACAPETGKCRAIVREEWPTGWTENTPSMQYLKDGKRFLWQSERSGFRNYYLYDLTGKLLATVTSHPFEVANVVRLDEATNTLHYMARSGDNHLKMQLHRVGLDGKGDRRLTDPSLHHSISLSPDGKHFVDLAQAHDTPPVLRVLDAAGKQVAELATSDISRAVALGWRKAEMFTYLAADGKTTLRGIVQFPTGFDPSRKYPSLLAVYGGPASASNTARETFVGANPTAEYGFLILNLDSRAAPGMGKRTLDAIYEKLGVVEMDDMAAGVKALAARPWFDASRVGVYGTSYGGYTSVMMLLRYPDLIHAASASSPVTDWRHYDTIYTERYMWIPQENAAGYDAGSAMTYADKLKGRLMLFYGTADNNVHPSNTMQLLQALNRAGKSYEVQVGPDAGHAGIPQQRMMEFFLTHLGTGKATGG